MASLLCEELLWPLLAILALGVVSCGGKAGSKVRNLAAGGASGSSSPGGAAGADAPDPMEPEPSIVYVTGNDGDIDPQATPECIAGFQGFSARMGGMSVDFKAFVFEPGDYEGDPVQILWLEARGANGEHYLAAAGTAPPSLQGKFARACDRAGSAGRVATQALRRQRGFCAPVVCRARLAHTPRLTFPGLAVAAPRWMDPFVTRETRSVRPCS